MEEQPNRFIGFERFGAGNARASLELILRGASDSGADDDSDDEKASRRSSSPITNRFSLSRSHSVKIPPKVAPKPKTFALGGFAGREKAEDKPASFSTRRLTSFRKKKHTPISLAQTSVVMGNDTNKWLEDNGRKTPVLARTANMMSRADQWMVRDR
eukprot:m.336560 g.336560  ORF g.336560 m.336560 type:complete len:157 (+) comp17890_c0_seq1:204-674(+)